MTFTMSRDEHLKTYAHQHFIRIVEGTRRLCCRKRDVLVLEHQSFSHHEGGLIMIKRSWQYGLKEGYSTAKHTRWHFQSQRIGRGVGLRHHSVVGAGDVVVVAPCNAQCVVDLKRQTWRKCRRIFRSTPSPSLSCNPITSYTTNGGVWNKAKSTGRLVVLHLESVDIIGQSL